MIIKDFQRHINTKHYKLEGLLSRINLYQNRKTQNLIKNIIF